MFLLVSFGAGNVNDMYLCYALVRYVYVAIKHILMVRNGSVTEIQE